MKAARAADRQSGHWRWLLLTVIAAVTGVVYRPSLGFQLTGDDYQWVQFAHHALANPRLLVADLASFYRPASTWTLVVDLLVWGWNSVGFRVTNLLLHVAAAFMLAMAAFRLGLGRGTTCAIALMWGCSVFASESAVSIAIRFQNLLFIAWMWLIVAWPREGEQWTLSRRWSAGAAVVLALFAKETWVMTPLLAFALGLRQWSGDWRRALRGSVPTAVMAVAYVSAYFVCFPSDKSYYRVAWATLLKVPQMIAAFIQVEQLAPSAFVLSVADCVSVLLLVSAAIFCIRRRLTAGLLGLVLMFAAMLPTLWVPYLPLRYTSIPFAAFLLIVGACAEEIVSGLSERASVIAVWGLTVAAMLFALAGAWAVRLELLDWRVVSDAHARLLNEAQRVAPDFPQESPVIAVRVERSNPYAPLVENPNGFNKLWFVRGSAPYGLVDWSALFEWVLANDAIEVDIIEPPSAPAAVLIHLDGKFLWGDPVEDGAAEVARLRSMGVPCVVIESTSTR